MGWNIAKAAHKEQLAGRVSDRARLVLDHMCWLSRDVPTHDDPAAEYWEGHKALGTWLFGVDGTSRTKQELLRRYINELIDEGLIEHVEGGSGRERARYRILVGSRWAPAKAVDNSYQEGLI